MTTRQPSFNDILAFENRALSRIYSEIKQQEAVLEIIKAILCPALARHIVHCVINKQKLSIYTDSASWASQLRFYNKNFSEALKTAGFSAIQSVEIKILLNPESGYSKKIHNVTIPTTQTIAQLRQQSLLCADSHLRQSLNKLSATLESLRAKKTDV